MTESFTSNSALTEISGASDVKLESDETNDFALHEERSADSKSLVNGTREEHIQEESLSDDDSTNRSGGDEAMMMLSASTDVYSHCSKRRKHRSSFELTEDVKSCLEELLCPRKTSKNADELEVCPLCSKNFCDYTSLRRHIQRIHINDKQHRCTQCEKSFNIRSDLNQHIKHMHGEKRFKCDKCQFGSSYPDILQSHVFTVHLNMKPHSCPLCSSMFSYRADLARHVRTVHNKERAFKCSVCGKRFSQQTHVTAHYKSVHCDEKPYSCHKCDYRCSRKGHLKQHEQAVHSGVVKGYQCPACEYKIWRKDYYEKHLQKCAAYKETTKELQPT